MPAGSYTVPLIEVVADPPQVTCLHCRLMQVDPEPHRPGPPPPQSCPPGHDPQLAVSPPHPSLCCPHALAGKSPHVSGVQGGGPPPHSLGVPPQPQHAPPEHVPQFAVRPPQPSL